MFDNTGCEVDKDILNALESFNKEKIITKGNDLYIILKGDYMGNLYALELGKYANPFESKYVFSNMDEENYGSIGFNYAEDFQDDLNSYIELNDKSDYYTDEKIYFISEVVKAFVNSNL